MLRTGGSSTKDLDTSETALNTTSGGGNDFLYKCKKCGKKGLKAKDCITPMGEHVKFEGNCNWCGKKSHMEKSILPRKEENQSPMDINTMEMQQ